jgi:hypothetical protein
MWSTVATRIAERRIAEDANEVQVGGASTLFTKSFPIPDLISCQITSTQRQPS